MKIYCQKCGGANEYSIEKPNFCQQCGNGFKTTKAAVAAPITNRHKTITRQEDEEEDPVSLEAIQSLSSLEVEISATPDRKVKIQNLLGTRASDSIANSSDNARPLNKQEAMESFKKEAGFYPVVRNNINEEE